MIKRNPQANLTTLVKIFMKHRAQKLANKVI